jgi:hypothetical protein
MRLGKFLVATALVWVGQLLFMDSLGYPALPWAAGVLRLWPLLLILVGLSLFWGGRIPVPLALLLVAALVLGTAWAVCARGGPGRGGAPVRELSVARSAYPGVETGALEVDFGAGSLHLGAGSTDWVDARLQGPGAVAAVEARGTELQVNLRPPSQFVVWSPRRQAENRWVVRLARDLPWTVSARLGATDAVLDLADLQVRRLDLETGAGAVEVHLGTGVPRMAADIQAGASRVTVWVPAGAGVSARVEGAFSDTNLGGLGWQREDGRYLSPGYHQAGSRIDLDVHLAAGSLHIRPHP